MDVPFSTFACRFGDNIQTTPLPRPEIDDRGSKERVREKGSPTRGGVDAVLLSSSADMLLEGVHTNDRLRVDTDPNRHDWSSNRNLLRRKRSSASSRRTESCDRKRTSKTANEPTPTKKAISSRSTSSKSKSRPATVSTSSIFSPSLFAIS